ncbi:PQQ-binding-like beta-propeller repeat protein [Arhodomonas sp. AD133]|uniref:PQQ-binding-like beta-propeller repeat protein n=1 Tax=Arhodomonas sp. AD133 TaxID=3415009 RepID=UPI003EC0431D
MVQTPWHLMTLVVVLLASFTLAETALAAPRRAMTQPDGSTCAVASGVVCWSKDGHHLWQALRGEQVLALTPGTPLLAAGSRGVAALDPDTGALRWRHGGERAFPPITHAGRAWFGTHNGTLWCVATATGEPCWRRSLAAEWIYTPARLGETLVSVGRNRTAWALDAREGTLRWTRPLPQEPVGAPLALTPTSALIATYDGTLRALDAVSGEFLWAYDADTVAAEWAAETGTLVVRLIDGSVLALDADTGKRLWRHNLPGAEHLTVHRELVWLAIGNRVKAFALPTGRLVAHHRLPAPAASPVTADGRVLLHARAQRLHALRRSSDASTTIDDPQ